MGESPTAALLLALLVGIGALYVAVWAFRRRMAQPSQRPGDVSSSRWSLDGGLRLVSGEQPGLTRRWRHGRVTVDPGLLTLRPYLFGLRFLPMRTVTAGVAGIDLAGEQRAGLATLLTVRPGARLVPLTTTTGAALQLAVLTTETAELFTVLAAGPART